MRGEKRNTFGRKEFSDGLALPAFERLFIHGANDVPARERYSSSLQACLDGLTPRAEDLIVLCSNKGKRIGRQHVAEPNALKRCKLIRTWRVMATPQGDKDELPCMQVRLPRIDLTLQQPMVDDGGKQPSSTHVAPRRLGRTHFYEQAGHVGDRSMVRHFQ